MQIALRTTALWQSSMPAPHEDGREHGNWHAVLKLSRRVKWKAVAKNLRERGFYGRLALPQFHADIWRILRYVLCPSLKKSHSELDGDPYFSSTFPLEQMESKMRKYASASFRPSDMFNALRNLRPRLTSYQELIAWAEQQRQRGNGKFQEFMARQGPKMQPLFLSWQRQLPVKRLVCAMSPPDCAKLWTTCWSIMERVQAGSRSASCVFSSWGLRPRTTTSCFMVSPTLGRLV